MSTKFYNTQWQMPNEANKSKQANYSLQRTSANQYVQADSVSINSGPSFTISCWVFGADIDTSGLHAFWGTQYYGTSTGGFVIYYGNGAVTFYSSLPGSGTYFTFSTANNLLVDNVWQQVTIRYNYGVDYRIYINNVLRAVNTTNNSTTWPEQNIRLFRHYSSDGYNHDGALSDWCFFNHALSDTATSVGDTATGQIAQLYGNGSSLSNPMNLSPAPKAYYKLSDSVWDGSEYITANNAAQDYVFDFNPNNVHGHINLGASTLTSNTYSLSLWFNSTSTSTQVITEKQTGTPWPYRIYLYGTGNLELLGTQTSGTVYNDGKWHNVVIVQDPSLSTGKSKGYVDGVLVTSSNSSGGVSSSNNFYIGGRGGTGLPYKGKLSNFQLFDAALSATEIETLYNYGSPIRTLANVPQSSNLKVWYKLDASEIYNSSSTEWSIDNNTNPSAYTSSLKFVASELDRIDMPYDAILNPSSNYTFSIWFNPTSINSNSTLVGSSILSRGINMYYPPNNTKVTFYHKTSTANESFDIVFPDSPVDTWNNITVTWSASTGIIRAFINGKYVSQKENISDIVWGGTLKVGQYTSYSWYFDGQLSNLAMWDATLTDGFSGTPTTGDVAGGQVAEVYNNGRPQTSITGSPVGWWKLDNQTTITDYSGNNFTATNNGATEYAGFVNTLAGNSSGMNQSNLVQSNLQTVAPYSKYAVNFDGVSSRIEVSNLHTFFNGNNIFSISCWVKRTTNAETFVCAWGMQGGGSQALYALASGASLRVERGLTTDVYISDFFPLNEWVNLTTVFDSSTNVKIYKNGSFIQDITVSATPTYASNIDFYMGNGINGGYGLHGNVSNLAIWDYQLSSLQVKEIYNEGLPSDLNIFSGTAPTHWWQLGEGVSYDGTYIYARDYIGNNHGVSAASTLDQTNIVNGVGTYSNGASSGFSVPSTTVTNITTDAPYSDKNALSINMQSAKSNSGISSSTPQAT